MIAPIARISPNPSFPGCYLLTVRCPFCGEEHGHGVGSGDLLPGVALHRAVDKCPAFGRLDQKGLRQKRRQQLEEGKALHEQCGGCYSIPLTISLYGRFKDGLLAGLWLGEMREMCVRAPASQGRAKV